MGPQLQPWQIQSQNCLLTNITQRYWNVSVIKRVTLEFCTICGVGKTLLNPETIQDAQPAELEWCVGRIKPECERLSGVFTVTGKNNAGGTGGVRLFCESDDVQLCVVTFPGDPFFALLNAVEEEAEIELDGWRDENRHSTIATDLYLSQVTQPKFIRENYLETGTLA